VLDAQDSALAVGVEGTRWIWCAEGAGHGECNKFENAVGRRCLGDGIVTMTLQMSSSGDESTEVVSSLTYKPGIGDGAVDWGS
jgi:hypothetical protein